MNTKRKGQVAEAKIAADLLEDGWSVYMPVSEAGRVDIVIGKSGALYRVQCKRGRYRDGVVKIHVKSTTWYGGHESEDYHGDVDYIASWCPKFDQTYLIPIEDVGSSQLKLRVDDPIKNHPAIRWADSYEV